MSTQRSPKLPAGVLLCDAGDKLPLLIAQRPNSVLACRLGNRPHLATHALHAAPLWPSHFSP